MMNGPNTINEQDIDWCWRAVSGKNSDFDGVFYFGVRTTGVFCRPSCSSRPPKRQNVTFFSTPDDAENAGFRACLRCKPKNVYEAGKAAVLIKQAFDLMRSDDKEIVSIEALCSLLGISQGYLQKTFKAILGLTPKEVLDLIRLERFKENVKGSDVTTSLYESGFGSSRALYETAGESLGMTPATYKKGGKGMTIDYTIVDSRLGKLLIAATEKGICSVSFGDTAEDLENGLKKEFFAAELKLNDDGLADAVNAILKSLDGEKTILTLPLDLHASVFQMRVWAELRKIPFGETRSYGEIAASLGNPKSFRAVARACATNPVALVNPCHRVIASDGKLSGYRWGIERKAELLKREKEIA